MTLPRFLDRVHDAAGPLLGGMASGELGDRLATTSVVLEMTDDVASLPGQRAGYLFAANLAARLYPRLGFQAPSDLADEAVALARAINPHCLLGPPRGHTLTVSWNGGEPAADRVTVAIDGWNISIDGVSASTARAVPAAALAGAALAIGELFRARFAPELEHGRTQPARFALNLVTLGDHADIPPLPDAIELGTVHLAGCGAVGQAAVAALRELPVTGTLVAVDHDPLDLGNLQRYVLSFDADVGQEKPALVARALEHHPLTVEPVFSPWGADERSAPGRDTVLAALDTKQGRIELQSGLPREIFNAWTQPEDVGVSRHQAFGVDPCLACLGWPKGVRPSDSELIAEALGEHELRVVLYLSEGTPVGAPLPPHVIAPTGRLPLPGDAGTWARRSLLDDVIERREIAPEELRPFADLGIRQLYSDVVCAGVLLEHEGRDRHTEVSVPLAHQSAIAGVLLATWLVIDRVPELRALRPEAPQARYDALRGGAQRWTRDRGRQPGCICSDEDFLAAYAARWPSATAPA
ncbi:MAG TPA: ThiF family adenylyltransferase [Solirubrobacteraceae bacterium]|nr:ThiF family adenylyltransferase [Solirubrobacteraceae bacterium]